MSFISVAAFVAEIQQAEVRKTSCKYVAALVTSSWLAVGHAAACNYPRSTQCNACFEWSKVESADNCEYMFECIVSAGELGRFNHKTLQRFNEAAH